MPWLLLWPLQPQQSIQIPLMYQTGSSDMFIKILRMRLLWNAHDRETIDERAAAEPC